jgi:hypothetical protein
MQLMYDGINALAPGIARLNPAMVAGYLDGAYAWSDADWALFPHANKVEITISASVNAGDVLDVENGDAKPSQAAGWIAMRKAAGYYRPTIYCSRSVIPAVRAGTGKYVLGKDYDIWVADYTGAAHEVTAPGLPSVVCAATQYESTPNWDVSMVYDAGWPHRSAAGVPAPTGMSGTPHVLANLTWAPVDHATDYDYQVAAGTPDKVGGVLDNGSTAGTHAQDVTAGLVQPCVWRVRVGKPVTGAWSAWKVLER